MPCYCDGMKTGKPSKSDKKDFSKRLCRLRDTAGLSQRNVAKQMGISQPSYANWESHNVSLKPEQLVHLADVLGVDVSELLEDHNKKRRGGPAGKVRRLFEDVSTLPRNRQQRIIAVVEDMVTVAKQTAGAHQ